MSIIEADANVLKKLFAWIRNYLINLYESLT